MRWNLCLHLDHERRLGLQELNQRVAARQELISTAARLAYPIRDGVPVMTPDEARPLDDDEVRRLAKR